MIAFLASILLILFIDSASAATVTQNIPITITATSGSITPQIIQHEATSPTPIDVGGPNEKTWQPYFAPTGAGDTVVFGFTGPSGQTPAVTDSSGDTIPAAVCTADAGAGNYVSYIYIIQPTAGTNWFKVVWSGVGGLLFDFVVTEFNNISSASAQGYNCQAAVTALATVVTPNSLTPANNDATGGNVIYNYTVLGAAARCNASDYTPAAGFTRLGGNTASWLNGDGFGVQTVTQYELQATHAAVVPLMAMPGENCSGGNGDPFNTLTIALKVGSAGIAYPTGIHVVQAIQMTTNTFGSPSLPATVNTPITAFGNLRVFMCESCGVGSFMSADTVTSSDGCNFTKVVDSTTGNYIWYAQGCSPCTNCTVSFHTSGGTFFNTAGQYYDIINASSSSYQNENGVVPICAPSSVAHAPDFTPGNNSAGVALAMLGIGNGPGGPILAPSGAVSTCPLLNVVDDGEFTCFGDWHGYYYYSSNASQNWTWGILGPGSSCAGTVAAFK